MKELKKDRIDVLLEKAKSGDQKSQFELAKAFYYEKRVNRSLPLAKYWAYRAVTNPNNNHDLETYRLYKAATAPHFIGSEQYLSFGEGYTNISLAGGSAWGSTKFRGKFDIDPNETKYYRTYLITRFIIFYFIRGAYRVYEPTSGSYRVLGKERSHFREYWRWLIPWGVLLLYIIIRSIFL